MNDTYVTIDHQTVQLLLYVAALNAPYIELPPAVEQGWFTKQYDFEGELLAICYGDEHEYGYQTTTAALEKYNLSHLSLR